MRTARLRAIAALVGGAVFATTSPPIDVHAGVLVGMVVLAAALLHEDRPRMRYGAWLGWLFGLGANLVALRFVPPVILRFTPLPAVAAYLALVLVAAFQGIPWAIAGAIAHEVPRRTPVPRWLGFGVGVYAATFAPSVFPWTPVGGLTPWPMLVQLADMMGERGVTMLLGCVSGLVARALSRRAHRARDLAVAGGVALVMVGYGALRTRQIDEVREAAPHATIALVMPGFDASDRWEATRAEMMMDRLTSLTKSAEARGVDLTVWPESAYPFTIPHATRRSPEGHRAFLHPGVRGPVLSGVYMAGGAHVGYNSAVLVSQSGEVSAPYDKRHLLAFGEAVPFGETFPALKRMFTKGSALSPGHESIVFVSGAMRIAVLNCFEDTLPEAGVEAMEHGPNLLVNITNDAWFVDSPESELHLRLAIVRAIETRRDLARSVNRGPTTHVDAAGRVRARYDIDIPGSLKAQPALLELPPTFYVRFGDWPWIALAVGLLLAPAAMARVRDRAAQNGTGALRGGERPSA
ncbi:MAG: apolipoprotein N-acyltransferase [Deltaproteobacteria bacterium]|nr:apolipoprotein N-acyltransferase [Deltaproteobacteria bacterium]